jgi:hypothetical protein
MKMPSAQGTLQDLAKPLNVRSCSYCLAANRGAYAGLPSILPAPAKTFTTRIKTQTNQQLSPQPKSTTPPKPPFLKIANWIFVGLRLCLRFVGKPVVIWIIKFIGIRGTVEG